MGAPRPRARLTAGIPASRRALNGQMALKDTPPAAPSGLTALSNGHVTRGGRVKEATMNVKSMIPWNRGRDVTTPDTFGGDPFMSLHREMNRLFDDMFRGVSGNLAGTVSWPSVELEDAGRELRVTAEVPGMSADDVELLLRDNILTLRGERKQENTDDSRRISERYYGRFERHIPLGVEVDEAGVRAEFKDGLLTVTLPKTEEATPEAKRIEIARG